MTSGPPPPPRPPTAGLAHLPVAVDGQPGFLDGMLRRISGRNELAGLSTREADDPTIGLFDAAATMLDVLAFYGEMIANESFLRSADERRSVLELARTIDYELAPGVAASTVLSFDVVPPPGSSPDVRIPAGIPAQKLPGEDQRVAVYETSSELIAREELNVLRPVVVEPAIPRFGDTEITLDGIGLGLAPGELLLVVGDERLTDPASEAWDVRSVVAVAEHPTEVGLDTDGAPARTVVTLDRPLGSIAPHVEPAAAHPRCHHLTVSGSLFGSAAMRYADLPVSLRVGEPNPDPSSTTRFLVGAYAGDSAAWVDAPLAAGTTELWLDRIHRTVTADSWLVLSRAGYAELYRVTAAEHGNHNAFMMSGPATKVRITGENTELFSIREAAVFAGSRELSFGATPVTVPVSGTDVVLDRVVDLAPGRLVAVSGTDADTGDPASEVLVVDHAAPEPATPAVPAGGTRVTFTSALVHRYEPSGLRLRANSVWATHGQTARSQPIGSGDASRDFLTLPLAVGDAGPGPLTYTAADTPSGATSSLEVRVDGVRWTEVETLAHAAPDDQVYVVRHGEGSSATIMFGDGRTGARPGSGRDNITATYRVGIGLVGHAAVGQITLPLGLPLGTRSVVNPIAATGGEDPETLDAARVNAPTTIRTLGRIVSVADVEDFARTFAGIGWASATELDDGDRPIVHLSVTLADGTPLPDGSATAIALSAAIDLARHDDRPVVVAGHRPRDVEVAAAVLVDERYVSDDVVAAATAAVVELFDKRPTLDDGGGYGKLVTPTKVLAALQRTDGVLGATLSVLRAVGTGGAAVTEVLARPARVEGGQIRPAEMLEAVAVAVTVASTQEGSS
jgi:predicted phage baseplate assembly protein